MRIEFVSGKKVGLIRILHWSHRWSLFKPEVEEEAAVVGIWMGNMVLVTVVLMVVVVVLMGIVVLVTLGLLVIVVVGMLMGNVVLVTVVFILDSGCG